MARTRANDFEEKRHNLLLDAARVFASQGMEKASMSQIAREAGVSKSLLYHYYPSKDALIFAIIEAHLEDLNAALAEATDTSLPPRAQLKALVMVADRQLRFHRRRQSFAPGRASLRQGGG